MGFTWIEIQYSRIIKKIQNDDKFKLIFDIADLKQNIIFGKEKLIFGVYKVNRGYSVTRGNSVNTNYLVVKIKF